MNPNLIEYSTKKFLFDKLQQCHHYRSSIYFYALNIGIFILFAGITYFALYFAHKNKLTEAEKKYKMMQEQDFIMSRIRFYQEMQKENNDSQYSNITHLPQIHS